MQLYYTTHHNWDWVVSLAIERIRDELPIEAVSVQKVSGFSQLPSVRGTSVRAEYSLFRIDLEDVRSSVRKYQIRVHSLGFADLDPKDALFRRLQSAGAETCMPKCTMIAWSAEETDIPPVFPSYPALLKAPMGSGGFGLYYVYHQSDIWPVVRNHRLRAEHDPAFIPKLLASYKGDTPAWSLQEIVPSFQCHLPVESGSSSKRRTQCRMYAVVCEDRLLLYPRIEVRMPLWNDDIDVLLAEETALFSNPPSSSARRRSQWTDPVEEECCGEGNARPYNEGRNKTETARYILEELPELIHAAEALTACASRALSALKPFVMSQHEVSRRAEYPMKRADKESGAEPPKRLEQEVHLAVLGMDFIVAENQDGPSPRVVMVEVNNNPAMPGEKKSMSKKYKQHLIDFVGDIVKVALSESRGVQDDTTWIEI